MIRGRVSSLVLAGAMLFSMAGVACGGHRAYRVYDPYYTDYHEWNGQETYYYRQWADETRRDPHRDFRKLPPADQKEYFTWRHNHGDQNHDRDHDRH